MQPNNTQNNNQNNTQVQDPNTPKFNALTGQPTDYGKSLGLSSPNANIVNNTPVNNTPNASSLGARPVVIPPNPTGTSQAANQAIGASQGALLGLQNQNLQAQQNAFDQTKNDTTGLINQYLGKGQEQLNMENQAGVPQLRALSNSLNNQYLTQGAAYNAQYNDIFNNPGMTREQSVKAISDLQQQHGYDLTNTAIQASIASTNYTNAENIINHQIDLKYAPVKDAIDFGMQFLQQNKDLLTQAQTQQFNAQLQVQSQTYNQGVFYSQLNATTGMDILKQATANGAPQDVIDKAGQLVASGATPGEIASTVGQYGSSVPAQMTWNPNTGQMAPYNANTHTFYDGTPVPPNSQSYNVTDSNSGKITTANDGTQYNWGSYNSDPQYGMKVGERTSTITSSVGQITNSQTAQAAINSFAPTSKLTGSMVMSAAQSAGIDPSVFMGHIDQESLMGSSNVAQQNNNFGGLTYTRGQTSYMGVPVTQGSPRSAIDPNTGKPEGGFYMKFATPQDGITAQARADANYKGTPNPTQVGQTPTVQSKIQTINQIKASQPSYIAAGISTVDQTGDGYIDLGMVSDPTGSGIPNNVALNQAKQLAQQYQKQGINLIPVTHDQALTIQAANGLLTNVNNIANSFQNVASSGIGSRAVESVSNITNSKLLNQKGQDVIAYNALVSTSLGSINDILNTKRVSGQTADITANALPGVASPSISSGIGGALAGAATGAGIGFFAGGIGAIPGAIGGAILGFGGGSIAGANGDTIDSGNAKLDNLRRSANATLTSLGLGFKGAPLSSELATNSISTTVMTGPDGKDYNVPNTKINDFISVGGKAKI